MKHQPSASSRHGDEAPGVHPEKPDQLLSRTPGPPPSAPRSKTQTLLGAWAQGANMHDPNIHTTLSNKASNILQLAKWEPCRQNWQHSTSKARSLPDSPRPWSLTKENKKFFQEMNRGGFPGFKSKPIATLFPTTMPEPAMVSTNTTKQEPTHPTRQSTQSSHQAPNKATRTPNINGGAHPHQYDKELALRLSRNPFQPPPTEYYEALPYLFPEHGTS